MSSPPPNDQADMDELRKQIEIHFDEWEQFYSHDNTENANAKEKLFSQILAAIAAKRAEWEQTAVHEFRDRLSTHGYPLSDPPQMVKQPVPCPRCGAEKYADWTLYPHQLYNSYMPGGIGHYCFPCFAAIVAGVDSIWRQVDAAIPERPSNELIQLALQNGKPQQAASYNGFAAAIDEIRQALPELAQITKQSQSQGGKSSYENPELLQSPTTHAAQNGEGEL